MLFRSDRFADHIDLSKIQNYGTFEHELNHIDNQFITRTGQGTGLSDNKRARQRQIKGLWDWAKKGTIQYGQTYLVISGVTYKPVPVAKIKFFIRQHHQYIGIWGKRGFIACPKATKQNKEFVKQKFTAVKE